MASVLFFLNNIWPMHFFFAVQILVSELMFAPGQEKRVHPVLRFTFGILFYLLLSWFHPTAGYWFVRVLCIFFWFFGLLMFCLRVSFRKGVFICLASYAIQNLAFNAGDLITSLSGISAGTAEFYLLTALVFIAVYVICWFCAVRRFAECGDTLIGNLRSLLLTIGTLIVVFGKNTLASLGWISTGDLLTLFTGISCILILFIQFSVLRESRIEEEKHLVEQMLNAEKETYQRLKDSINIINMKCHDLRYYISEYQNRQGEAVSAAQEEFFQGIEKSVMIYDNTTLTGNPALDVLLSDRLLYCNANHIEVSYIVDATALAQISASDIYSFFGNALDNAIQCVMKSDVAHRFISLSVRRNAGMCSIILSNYCDHPPRMKDGLPVSDGDPSYHGFGMRAIRYITEKYNGDLLIDASESSFTLSVLIPLTRIVDFSGNTPASTSTQ